MVLIQCLGIADKSRVYSISFLVVLGSKKYTFIFVPRPHPLSMQHHSFLHLLNTSCLLHAVLGRRAQELSPHTHLSEFVLQSPLTPFRHSERLGVCINNTFWQPHDAYLEASQNWQHGLPF